MNEYNVVIKYSNRMYATLILHLESKYSDKTISHTVRIIEVLLYIINAKSLHQKTTTY